jgi:hypothetical protein
VRLRAIPAVGVVAARAEESDIRPVLKHGPRSLTYMQAESWQN